LSSLVVVSTALLHHVAVMSLHAMTVVHHPATAAHHHLAWEDDIAHRRDARALLLLLLHEGTAGHVETHTMDEAEHDPEAHLGAPGASPTPAATAHTAEHHLDVAGDTAEGIAPHHAEEPVEDVGGARATIATTVGARTAGAGAEIVVAEDVKGKSCFMLLSVYWIRDRARK
jgi:hypothetical protein